MESSSPKRAGLVLATLILVAGIANVNLAVANVALPDIGKAFSASQTSLNLVAIGYSLGLAGSVLYLGALGDRYGRKQMVLLGMAVSIPASLLAGLAPSVEVLFVARVLGGVAAGMAYPTTLALVAALWSGPERTHSIALWSAVGGAISALGPVLSGALLEGFDWGSVFLVTIPLAAIGLLLAWRYIPNHVNEATDPVDNLGGILSVVFVASLALAINLAPVPETADVAIGLGVLALVTVIAFTIRQKKARFPLYDLVIARRPTFWVAAVAGIIVFGVLMGAMFIGQQYLQNVLGYSTLDAGLSILPTALLMILVAPRSAKLVETRGARFTLLIGFLFLDLGFLTMLRPLGTEHPVLAGRARVRPGRHRGRAGRHPRLAVADRLGAGPAGGDGLGDRRPTARPRRLDHAVDPRRPADRRLRGGDERSDRLGTRASSDHPEHRRRPDQVLLGRRGPRRTLPPPRHPDHLRRPRRRSCRATTGPTRWGSWRSSSARPWSSSYSPSTNEEKALLAQYHAEDA